MEDSAVPTTLERNKNLVRRVFEEVIGQRRFELAHELLRPDYIQHNPSAGQGIDGFLAYFRDLERTQRRLRVTSTTEIVLLMAEADHVCAHTRTRMSGWISLDFTAMDIFRIEDGRLAEHWDVIQGRGTLSALALLLAG